MNLEFQAGFLNNKAALNTPTRRRLAPRPPQESSFIG
jgi:hypothetical protein